MLLIYMMIKQLLPRQKRRELEDTCFICLLCTPFFFLITESSCRITMSLNLCGNNPQIHSWTVNPGLTNQHIYPLGKCDWLKHDMWYKLVQSELILGFLEQLCRGDMGHKLGETDTHLATIKGKSTVMEKKRRWAWDQFLVTEFNFLNPPKPKVTYCCFLRYAIKNILFCLFV